MGVCVDIQVQEGKCKLLGGSVGLPPLWRSLHRGICTVLGEFGWRVVKVHTSSGISSATGNYIRPAIVRMEAGTLGYDLS
jgi:hypothetical protein